MVWFFLLFFIYAGPCQAAGGTPGAHGFFTYDFALDVRGASSLLLAFGFIEQLKQIRLGFLHLLGRLQIGFFVGLGQ